MKVMRRLVVGFNEEKVIHYVVSSLVLLVSYITSEYDSKAYISYCYSVQNILVCVSICAL